MSIRQVGILNYFRFWQAYRMPQGGEVWLISRALRETHPHPDSRRAASVRATSKTKALRIIFAGRLGSAPAVTTLLTANNSNVFIIFPPDCVTDSPVMYTAMVGINVYPSSRNFKLFFGSCARSGPLRSGRPVRQRC